jgi:hypothetical protein
MNMQEWLAEANYHVKKNRFWYRFWENVKGWFGLSTHQKMMKHYAKTKVNENYIGKE